MKGDIALATCGGEVPWGTWGIEAAELRYEEVHVPRQVGRVCTFGNGEVLGFGITCNQQGVLGGDLDAGDAVNETAS